MLQQGGVCPVHLDTARLGTLLQQAQPIQALTDAANVPLAEGLLLQSGATESLS